MTIVDLTKNTDPAAISPSTKAAEVVVEPVADQSEPAPVPAGAAGEQAGAPRAMVDPPPLPRGLRDAIDRRQDLRFMEP